MQRGQFSSRWAFVLAASGSAVGLGNIWGFPTNAAENGGAAFLLAYLLLAFILAYPALMAELIIGRHAQANMVNALEGLSPQSWAQRLGRATGLIGVVTASAILCFYSIIAGWMIAYLLQPAALLAGQVELASWMTQSSVERNLFFVGVFMALTGAVIASGVEQGIEKWSRRLMPALFVLLVLLIGYVLTRPGADEGLRHYLVPDFAQLSNPQLLVSALGQAFFSMSLGVGTMLIYGSYISREENLPKLGVLVTLTDTSVAFLAGLLVLPAMFVAKKIGVDIYADGDNLIAGPDLIFQVLPALFEQMGSAGLWVAASFFLLMSIAALTSSISMLEVPVALITERFSVGRHRATAATLMVLFFFAAIIVVNFDPLFGWVVSLSTETAQPLLGMLLCLYAGWLFRRDKLLAEIKQGNAAAEQQLFWKVWPFYVRFICPLLILLMLVDQWLN